MKTKKIYLDYAAATPIAAEVKAAMEPYLSQDFYNPSATYLAARKVRHDINAARAVTAGLLGCRPAEIIFTSGATESNNLAILGIHDAFPKAEILVSSVEHESVLAPAAAVRAKPIPVKPDGIVDLVKLEQMIGRRTVLISVGLVNNEIGTLQPLREIASLVNRERTRRLKRGTELPIYLHSDAAQAANFLDLHISRLGVDTLSVNGAKLYGPKQTGLLYVKAGVKLRPRLIGGGQEFGLRAGTENVAGIIGLAKALEIAQAVRVTESERLAGLRRRLESVLASLPVEVKINGSLRHRAPHIVSASFKGWDNERLMIELDERGIEVATGSACSASSDEPSHVLRAIGLKDKEARSTLRFSLGRGTSEKDIEKLEALLKDLFEPRTPSGR